MAAKRNGWLKDYIELFALSGKNSLGNIAGKGW